jgi:hypothetical protein
MRSKAGPASLLCLAPVFFNAKFDDPQLVIVEVKQVGPAN